jgi:hypothetical protein
MKKLNLINLHKVEIKKNMLAQIKGGIDVKCYCSMNNPLLTTKQSGGPVGELCVCTESLNNGSSVQTKTSL